MSANPVFIKYLKELSAITQQGDAREESYYSALADMIKAIADSTGRKHVRVTTLPKLTDAGNPDFRLWNGKNHIIGYMEAKKPTEERLDLIEDSEQLKRYRSTFPNLILTNFLEFRLYRNGERIETIFAARPKVLNRSRTAPVMEKQDELIAMLDRFLGYSLPKAFTAETLAIELAKRTRFLRDIVEQELSREKDAPGMLSGFFEAFQTYLIGTLNPQDFSDLFAQTITYGLFAARTRAGDEFNRRTAFDSIPHTIGVLRDLFRFISLGELSEQLAWCVDDIAEVLAVADAPGILDRYYHERKGSDPIVHFYETFLAHYDPEERERRGVYYTPEPVVSYIVRSLHGILKAEFGKSDGLASDGVTLLDPAAGTMTFVARAAQEAVAEFRIKYGSGGRKDFIRRHVLQNFFAFELMMAPYAVGHLKMGFFLEELGHRLSDHERVHFYLTNTLDMEELEQSRLPGFSALAEESRLAGQVKKKTPILVILGNPPYSGISSNTGKWITELIEDYKQVDGKPLGERNPKWLQDDYVKFLRFAQWKIEQAGRGVVGMITNHGYLDNPTFRGMRQSLMQTFNNIFALDLHGSSLKKEACPDGSPDQNVFDIRQGVAIVFLVKRGGTKRTEVEVHHADLFGKREVKYAWLDHHEHATTKWSKIEPRPPFYLFVPQDLAGLQEYRRFPIITEVFPLNGVGMTTARDGFVIDEDKEGLIKRIRLFKHNKGSDDELHRLFSIKRKKGWSIRKAWDMLQKVPDSQLPNYVVSILYRPFDTRWIFYHDAVVWRTVKRVMHHMLAGDNKALLVPRQVTSSFRHAFASNLVTNFNNIDTAGKFGSGYQFPLYLYPTESGDLFDKLQAQKRKPNIDPRVFTALSRVYGKKPTPEDIFHYVYAVLYSPTYREKYEEFLRRDFPRVPFTADPDLFAELAGLGKRLVELHLMQSPELYSPACRFEVQGDNCIGKGRKAGLRYDSKNKRMYINATQYFAPVPEGVWSYKVGGYQVCEKWLKDRQVRRLELGDIRNYCRIVTALGVTIQIQEQIDALYFDLENNVVTI